MDNKQINYIMIRRAHLKDCKLVYDLSNDPLVRKMSFNSVKIKYKDHVHWFVDKINDKDFLLLLAFTGKQLIGQIKFETGVSEKRMAMIGISIAEKFRGKGISKKVLRLSHEYIRKAKSEIERIYAEIKKENVASNKLFSNFGYKIMQRVCDKTKNVYVYNLNKED